MSDAIEVTRRRLLAAGLSLPAAALANSPSLKAVGLFTESGKHYVVDLYGRRVEIPSVVKRFVCTGTGTLRITSYLMAFDRLVGIESTDQRYRHDPKRDYAYANHAFFKTLPIIGKGGGNAFTANPEAILSLEPDVIFTGYAPEATEQLARETGLPVISVSYRSLGIVHDTFFEAIKLVGSVLGLEKRAQSVIEFVAKATADLERRTADLDGRSGPSVYPGAVTYMGSHGFMGTYSNFGPLSIIRARSISDRFDREGFYEADPEFILEHNPDVIFLDPSNLPLVTEEIKTKRGFFEALKAIREKRVYSLPSYNQYSTNVSYSLADAYYAGTVLFPERFADVDFKKKFNEITSFFNGRGWYDDMAKYGQGYGPLVLL